MPRKQEKSNKPAPKKKVSGSRKRTASQSHDWDHHKDTTIRELPFHGQPRQRIYQPKEKTLFSKPILALLVLAVLVMGLNQIQISQVSAMSGSGSHMRISTSSQSVANLAGVDFSALKSTGHTVQAVFPELEEVQTPDEVMNVMFPTGTPEYGDELGVSFDDPIASLETLSRMYPALKAEVESNNPEAFQRFVALGNMPVGISCEYCCGVGPIGMDANGNSRCGCQHNPALLTVALYLTTYTDYTDADILREVMRWKTLFFPQNMIDLGMTVSGGDTSKLQDLPGMVGGC